jgi:hypothetical protein
LFLAFISFFSLIVIKNNRNLLFFGILATISLYLAMGSNAPFGFYEWLAFDSPLKHIGWCYGNFIFNYGCIFNSFNIKRFKIF